MTPAPKAGGIDLATLYVDIFGVGNKTRTYNLLRIREVHWPILLYQHFLSRLSDSNWRVLFRSWLQVRCYRPLSEDGLFCFAGLQGFEPWSEVLETFILPLNYRPIFVPPVGLEPTTPVLKARYSKLSQTNWVTRAFFVGQASYALAPLDFQSSASTKLASPPFFLVCQITVVGREGFEPSCNQLTFLSRIRRRVYLPILYSRRNSNPRLCLERAVS
jgi:hypothetical protein